MTQRVERSTTRALALWAQTGALALALLAGCADGSGEATPPAGESSGSGVSTSVPATDPDLVPDCDALGLSVPDGRWSGPLVVDIVTETARASGAVYGIGDGHLDLTMEGGVVTAGTWELTGAQEGDIATAEATNHVSSRFAVSTGSRPA